MKYFLKRLILFIAIPIVLVIGAYIYFDPFKVIYNYDNYSNSEVILNRDFTTTENYFANKEKYKYNSFLFGSSRTIGFKIDSWNSYLGENSAPYAFVGAGESIYGIHKKLQYLDSTNTKIDNALILLCRDWSFANKKDHLGHIFMKHPTVARTSWINFHWKTFMAYFNTKFIWTYFNFKITKEFKDWMRYVITEDKTLINPLTNQMSFPEVDERIRMDAKKYYLEKDSIFFKRKGQTIDTINRIDSDYQKMLTEIKFILEKNKTNYTIIAVPLYDQIKFSKNDSKILSKLFGNRIFDYTGKNKYTDYKENYYESSHFLPKIGDDILKEIYQEKSRKNILK